ncbi:M23 family metallopeptidase [Propioniciclava soli]|uniref:M23 family metallopeptidase n=1 Tax=Propioniciclava soli TaxID=2775081 RepID=UPI001E408DEC
MPVPPPGSPRPRQIDDVDAPASVAGDRRSATVSRVVRIGIAVAAASAVGALALVSPGLDAQASNAAPTATTPSPAAAVAGSTDAFTGRETSTSRDQIREELAAGDVAAAASDRAAVLDEVGEQVADAQTSAAAAARSEALASTVTAIDSEAQRIAEADTFFWPTEGGISSAWGMRLHPILHYTRLHGGADIGGAVGAPIYAVLDGVVTKAASGYNSGSGNNVRIDHGTVDGEALETAYLHMDSFIVAEGETVKRGQLIGYVGNTGLSTAPHLHFSVYVNGVNSDPAPYLARGQA